MSCKCKNIIENFQGGTIPLDTSFLGNVDICGTGSTLSVSNIIGCSPITIGSDSGCTSGNTTLIVSGSSVFSCDIDVLGGIYSGGTNLIDIFSSGGGGTFTGNTSATCINELWVSNISGCSPVTIGTDMVVTGDIRQTGETLTFSNGYYTQISTGFANTGQLTFNANHDGGVTTNTYTPTYAGDVNAGMTVVKMPSGGQGGLDFYVKKHGTTGGSQDLSTFTKILELNQDGNSTFGGNILLGDGDVSGNYAGFGNNADLKIFHNGGHSIIREVGTGNLYLQSDQNVILSKDSSTEFMVRGIADGAVELYYDNVKKLETTTDGVDIVGTLNLTGTTFISGTTGNTVSTLGIDNNGNVVEQKKVVTVTLGPSELIGSVAGTNYLPPITVPPNKYAKVTVHRIFTYNSVAYNNGLVFGLSGPTNTYFALPTNTFNSISEGINFYYVTTGNPTPQFGIWHSVGTAPTVGDGIMKFRLEYEFFDL